MLFRSQRNSKQFERSAKTTTTTNATNNLGIPQPPATTASSTLTHSNAVSVPLSSTSASTSRNVTVQDGREITSQNNEIGKHSNNALVSASLEWSYEYEFDQSNNAAQLTKKLKDTVRPLLHEKDVSAAKEMVLLPCDSDDEDDSYTGISSRTKHISHHNAHHRHHPNNIIPSIENQHPNHYVMSIDSGSTTH